MPQHAQLFYRLAKLRKEAQHQRGRATASACEATTWRFVMPVHLGDSLIYRNSWGTQELRELFDDVPRTRAWLEILAVLAETQAECDLIPGEAARALVHTCRTIPLHQAFFDEGRAGVAEHNP